MNILAICSALNNSYIALDKNGTVTSEIIKSDKNYHSLYLVKKIKAITEENKLKIDDIDLIAVNTGPGSFTGIRVALSIAKVAASELNIPLIPLNTAEILLNAYEADFYLSDARRDMYFIGTKDRIELVFKEKFREVYPKIKDKKIVCDSRLAEYLENVICYEKENADIGKVILEIAKQKYANSEDKSEFNPMLVKANYIQTPPIF